MMTVKVVMDDRRFGVMANRADRYGISVGEYLQLVAFGTRGKFNRYDIDVVKLHTQGLNDCQIARRLDVKYGLVRSVRHRLGLPANAKRGEWAERQGVPR